MFNFSYLLFLFPFFALALKGISVVSHIAHNTVLRYTKKTSTNRGYVLIKIQNVSKNYGSLKALDDISFTIPSNSVTALVGLNGAGKTTLLKSIVDSGCITVNNIPVESNLIKIKNEIGFVKDQGSFPLEVSAYELLFHQTNILFPKLSNDEKIDAIFKISDTFSILNILSQKVGTLSKGYKQRLSFAYALLHDPSVLLLDEPTSGLDPEQIIEMRQIIQSFSSTKTILMSTHLMQEVEALCSNIAIIHKGSLIAYGTETELCKLSNADTLEKAFLNLVKKNTREHNNA